MWCDDFLFRQPDESYLGNCPICCLPMPLDWSKWCTTSCCFKRYCNGCRYANYLREMEQGLVQRCLFCREPLAKSNEEIKQKTLERVKVNDPVALYAMGASCHREGNYEGAFMYWTKAIASGDIEAHYALSVVYDNGQGVEMDQIKRIYHLEKAAIGGHPQARYHLGCFAGGEYMFRRAMRHFIIAANLGYKPALEEIELYFSGGIVNEEDYPSALCGYQAAVDATKSAPRDEAEKARREGLF